MNRPITHVLSSMSSSSTSYIHSSACSKDLGSLYSRPAASFRHIPRASGVSRPSTLKTCSTRATAPSPVPFISARFCLQDRQTISCRDVVLFLSLCRSPRILLKKIQPGRNSTPHESRIRHLSPSASEGGGTIRKKKEMPSSILFLVIEAVEAKIILRRKRTEDLSAKVDPFPKLHIESL